jgi:hypothetical protein
MIIDSIDFIAFEPSILELKVTFFHDEILIIH